MRIKFILLSLIFSALTMAAQNYVAVNKNAKIYDEANQKYITLNQNNQEVSVSPGMAFKQNERTPGWVKIEYSPGLHAYIQDAALASELNTPVSGNYKVSNNPGESVIITQDGDKWSLKSGEKIYTGNNFNNIVIFVNDSNQPTYSLTDIGNGGTVFTYDSNITKFF